MYGYMGVLLWHSALVSAFSSFFSCEAPILSISNYYPNRAREERKREREREKEREKDVDKAGRNKKGRIRADWTGNFVGSRV